MQKIEMSKGVPFGHRVSWPLGLPGGAFGFGFDGSTVPLHLGATSGGARLGMCAV